MTDPADTCAIYSNIACMTLTSHGVRISFGETTPEDEEFYRMSVYMPSEIAQRFHEMLTEGLQRQAMSKASKPIKSAMQTH